MTKFLISIYISILVFLFIYILNRLDINNIYISFYITYIYLFYFIFIFYSFRQSLQDTKEMYNSPSQPLHSSQQIPSQQFSYYDTQSSLNQSTDPSIQNPPSQSVQPTNLYLYNNGSPSIASQSLEYSSFHGEINEGDKLNLKNNFQMRKLKKAKLKRQKKAEYIDFLEQRISQLDRIIKQNNLTFVEPSQDSVKKIETSSSLDNNNALSFPKINSVSKPKLISPLATNIQSSNKNIDNLTNRIPSGINYLFIIFKNINKYFV